MGSTANEMMRDDMDRDDEVTMDAGDGDDGESGDTTPETEEIRADIEQTRADMTVTINAIQDKLNPENLVEQAKEQVREATIGRVEQMVGDVGDKVGEVANQAQDTAGGLMRTIRDNPVPAALAAIGLGWLLTRGGNGNGSNRGSYSARRYPSSNDYGYNFGYRADVRPGYGSYGTPGAQDEGPVERVQERVGEVAGQVGDTVGDVAGRAGDTAGDVFDTIKRNPIPAALAGAGLWMLWNKRNEPQYTTYRYSDASYRNYGGERRIGDTIGQVPDKVGDAAGEVKDKVGEVAGQVGDRVGQVAGQVGQTAGNVAGQVGDAVGQAPSQLQRMLYENPLVVGAAALVIGAAVGLAVPETEPEHRIMGPARDNLMDKAQEVAQDTMDKVKRVADEATQTVKDEAANQGLTGNAGNTGSTADQSGGAGYSL